MKCFRIFAAFALIVVLMSGAWAACAMAEGDSARQYAEAAALLQAGNYAGAAQAYSMLGNYEDSSRMAMYCQAIAAGERGYYSLAVSNLKKLGDFRDAALQSNYYRRFQQPGPGGSEAR